MVNTTNRDPLQALSGRRCLVTGHTGFKGSWLTLCLQRLGAQVFGYALEPPTIPSLFYAARIIDRCAGHTIGDIRDKEALRMAVEIARPEVVFHLAAQSLVGHGLAHPNETFDVNLMGTVTLLDALRNSPDLKALVVITTDKCYRPNGGEYAFRESDPLGGEDPYSASKACTEIAVEAYRASYFRESAASITTVRAGNVIGGGDWATHRLVPDMIRFLSGIDAHFSVRNPDAIRPWQHVLDPLYGYMQLASQMLEGNPKAEGAFNFGPDLLSHVAVRNLVTSVFSHWGRTDANTWLEDAAASFKETQILRLASHKVNSTIGWVPRWDLKQMIRRTSDWYQSHAQGMDATLLCEADIAAYFATHPAACEFKTAA